MPHLLRTWVSLLLLPLFLGLTLGDGIAVLCFGEDGHAAIELDGHQPCTAPEVSLDNPGNDHSLSSSIPSDITKCQDTPITVGHLAPGEARQAHGNLPAKLELAAALLPEPVVSFVDRRIQPLDCATFQLARLQDHTSSTILLI